MRVNEKRLAEILNVDPRTIERQQSQGLPCAPKGSKGIESVFNTAMTIQWYAQKETDIENEKLRKELADLRVTVESDLQPGTIDYGRYRLTKAQVDAQGLKNACEDGMVLKTELFTFILQRAAQEISGVLVRMPLTLQRKYPDISPSHLDVVKTKVAKASNVAAKAGEDMGGWTDGLRCTEGSQCSRCDGYRAFISYYSCSTDDSSMGRQASLPSQRVVLYPGAMRNIAVSG